MLLNFRVKPCADDGVNVGFQELDDDGGKAVGSRWIMRSKAVPAAIQLSGRVRSEALVCSDGVSAGLR